ncbi:MAG: hypothetical protein HY720_08840 [Planctomycetes bacterium]|nr:hypothetical protein [Planctomycetota bacterium]
MSLDHYTLGFSFALGHGTSGVLLKNGHVAAAANLERLLQMKYAWLSNPEVEDDTIRDIAAKTPQKKPIPIQEHFERLLDYLLSAAGISLSDVSLVAYDKYSCATSPYRTTVEGTNAFLDSFFKGKDVVRVEHHVGHQAQAFYPSPFEEAAILTVDGGSYDELPRLGNVPQSSSIAHGKGRRIETLLENIGEGISGKEYMRTTVYIGFGLNEDGKTMGLAPYGGPDIHDQIKVKLKYRLNPFYRRRHTIRPEYDFPRDTFHKFCKDVRAKHHKDFMAKPCRDLAWAVQKRIEERVIRAARAAHELTGSKNLVYAGGVALNSVANRKILQETPFERIFVYPNAGDCGLAAGYALWAYYNTTDGPRQYVARHDYLGKPYSDRAVQTALDRFAGRIRVQRIPRKGDPGATEGRFMESVIADRIAGGEIVGWFQGGAEFGPRALGHRSILCDCRKPEHKDILNARVKHREGFRPFAPAVPLARQKDYFDLDVESPYMLLVPEVHPHMREVVPAITHVDGTARVQTVTPEDNDAYYTLIDEFGKKTGVYVILNTSFNLAGKPIVETPADAIESFLSTQMDALVVEDCLIEKK